MACKDCFNNCTDGIISDGCVQYTGPAIPLLGICTGDQLSTFESKVANALLTALDGTGITPTNVTLANCQYLSDLLGVKAPNLSNLLQLLIDANCSLKTMVDTINQTLATQNGTVWDLRCLTGLPPQPTSNQIVQAIIALLCTLNSTVAQFPSTYVQASDLVNLVTPIVQQIITAANSSNGVAQQNTKMVPNVAYEYYGSLSNFDAGGVGITSLGYQKVYICNGANGTPDKRGRVAVGAVKNVPGGALDAAVDPAVNPNNPNWNLLDKAGENFHVLTLNEIPAHTHAINDPGHTHALTFVNYINISDNGAGTNIPTLGSNPGPGITVQNVVTRQMTGITVASAGGGQGHITYQPSIAANYIMYIP